MSETILQVRDLYFSYDGSAPALDGVSLSVQAGERVAVLGANGAGKSTFFLCLNGVLTPARGEIALGGEPVGGKARRRLCEQVGIVFQNADEQILAPTVAAEVSFGPVNLRLPREEVARRVDDALAYMELTPLRARPPHELSGGEKKRVTIADVLAMESRVLLLDEPAASLDPAGAARLEQVLARLHEGGKTLLISTHDMDFALRWADRVVVFAEGRVAADGAPAAVLRDAALLARARLRPPLLVEVVEALRGSGVWAADMGCPRTIQELERGLLRR